MIRAVIPPKPAVVRAAQRACALAAAMALVTIGILIGWLVAGYQYRVAIENMSVWGARVVMLEEDYQRHHAPAHRTTKAQAQVIAQNKEGRQ